MRGAMLAVGWRTETGRRPANQDAVLVERLPDGRELVVVADGMGGHQAGEIASQQALESVRTAVIAGAPLRAAVAAANAAVYAAARESPEREGMGTTLLALLWAGGRYEVANVGDSRAYRIDRGGVRQLTTDHSFVTEAIAAGQMSAAEARQSPWANALTRAIGTEPEVDVDVFGPYDAGEPHVVVLCSDGFHGSVSTDLLGESLAHAADPQALASRLTQAAYLNGSTDNISVAVVRFGGASGADTTASDRAGADPTFAARPRAIPARPSSHVLLAPRRRSSWRTRLRRALRRLYARYT